MEFVLRCVMLIYRWRFSGNVWLVVVANKEIYMRVIGCDQPRIVSRSSSVVQGLSGNLGAVKNRMGLRGVAFDNCDCDDI